MVLSRDEFSASPAFAVGFAGKLGLAASMLARSSSDSSLLSLSSP